MSLKLKTFIRRNYATDTVLHLAIVMYDCTTPPRPPTGAAAGCLILLNSPSLSGSKIQLSLSGANDFVKGSRLRLDRRWAGGLSPPQLHMFIVSLPSLVAGDEWEEGGGGHGQGPEMNVPSPRSKQFSYKVPSCRLAGRGTAAPPAFMSPHLFSQYSLNNKQ